MKTRRRRLLRITGIGCAVAVAIVLVAAGWIALQIREMGRPVVLDGVHPFKSESKKKRYLAAYDERARRWPGPALEAIVDTSWGETFVRISGPAGGSPLVLLPGANSTSLLWQPNVEAWSQGYRVFAIDNIYDFGRSVFARHLTTPADFVDWLDEVFDGLGLDRGVHLLGLSYGGWIAAEYGLVHPERLASLTLAAPAATVAWFSDDFIRKGLSCIIPHPYFVKSMVRWALHDAADGTPTERRIVDEAAENAWLALRCFKLKQLVSPRVLTDEEWRGFEVPVLFLVGENEVIYSITGEEAVARVNRVAPEIETELFSGCGHDLTLVEADRFNRRVLEFLGSNTKPAPVY